MKRSQAGFTLIELLIVVALAALILPAGYSTLNMTLRAKDNIEVRTTEKAQVVRLMGVLQQDLEQSLNRAVRSELGDVLSSLSAGVGVLEVTRAGWANPMSDKRTQMQRVSYRHQGDALVRQFWDVIDRDLDSQAKSTTFEGVTGFSVTVLTENGWQEQWPNESFLVGDSNTAMPVAAQVIISTKAGSVTRLFELPNLKTQGAL